MQKWERPGLVKSFVKPFGGEAKGRRIVSINQSPRPAVPRVGVLTTKLRRHGGIASEDGLPAKQLRPARRGPHREAVITGQPRGATRRQQPSNAQCVSMFLQT